MSLPSDCDMSGIVRFFFHHCEYVLRPPVSYYSLYITSYLSPRLFSLIPQHRVHTRSTSLTISTTRSLGFPFVSHSS